MTRDYPLPAAELYRRLSAAYGPQHWWPGETPLEVIVGAVLTQNTAWRNVSLAISQLKSQGLLELNTLLATPAQVVKDAIRPSGFYNLKYERLCNVLAFLAAQGGIAGAAAQPGASLRAELLGVHGIGPETADSILLYALQKPFFVVDSYTRRLLSRLGHGWAEDAPYANVQAWFTQELPPEVPLYNEYHALIVQHGKACCHKAPLCVGCPLAQDCPASDQEALAQGVPQPLAERDV